MWVGRKWYAENKGEYSGLGMLGEGEGGNLCGMVKEGFILVKIWGRWGKELWGRFGWLASLIYVRIVRRRVWLEGG